MINLQKAPKQFCENISVAFSKEFFVMGLMNGENGVAYTLTPGHMKRLQQYLSHQIEDFERKHGEIQTEPWSKDIKSPLQINPPQG